MSHTGEGIDENDGRSSRGSFSVNAGDALRRTARGAVPDRFFRRAAQGARCGKQKQAEPGFGCSVCSGMESWRRAEVPRSGTQLSHGLETQSEACFFSEKRTRETKASFE